MRILLIAKRAYTNRDLLRDRFGRLYHLPVQLAALGHTVEVWALDHRRGAVAETLEPVPDCALHAVPLGISALPWMQQRLQGLAPEVVIASGHLHQGILAQALAHQRGIPWVYDLYDFYPAFFSRWALGRTTLFAHLCQSADFCLAASEALRQWVLPHNPACILLENGYDPACFAPLPPRPERGDGTLRVGLIGSLSPDLGFTDALAASELLRARGLDARLVVAGRAARGICLEHPAVESHGMLPQERLRDLLTGCDIALVPYRETEQVRFSNSCKLVEYLALGLPVVATRTGDHARYLPADHPGWCLPGDPASMAAAIERQAQVRLCLPVPQAARWASLALGLQLNLAQLIGW